MPWEVGSTTASGANIRSCKSLLSNVAGRFLASEQRTDLMTMTRSLTAQDETRGERRNTSRGEVHGTARLFAFTSRFVTFIYYGDIRVIIRVNEAQCIIAFLYRVYVRGGITGRSGSYIGRMCRRGKQKWLRVKRHGGVYKD
jgi:hypothetical protein